MQNKQYFLMSLHLTNPLACLDLETTGIDIVNDRIIEIAVIKLMPNGEKFTLHKRINPEKEIPIEATLIHGISLEDLSDKPTFKQVAKELAAFFKRS